VAIYDTASQKNVMEHAHETDETSYNHLDFSVLFLVMTRKMTSTVTTAG
jgi:hypothetical protein